MSEGTGWVAQDEDDSGDHSGGPPRPPIWVVAVVVVSVVVGGWLLATRASTDGDSVAGQTTIPFEPFATTLTVVPVDVAVFRDPADPDPSAPQRLAGYVVVASPDSPPFDNDNMYVIRPDGSFVSRSDDVIGTDSIAYPMLTTSGHVIVGGRDYDIDFSEPPMSLWTNAQVFPGPEPGTVWVWLDYLSPQQSMYRWLAQVDVESGMVGERFDIGNLFVRPVAGVADGLIVVPDDEGQYGDFAYWSPTDGLAPLELPEDPGWYNRDPQVVAASGALVVVDGRDVTILDFASREYVRSFQMGDVRNPVRSACLSPDGTHVIVVAWNGESFVGNTRTGEMIDLNPVNAEFPIQQKHGIGWTAHDQLVFIGSGEFAKNITAFDVTTGESFVIAQLDGSRDWWLAASGAMC